MLSGLKNLCIVAAFRCGRHTGDNHADVCTSIIEMEARRYESTKNLPIHFLAACRSRINSFAGGADETADKNGGAVLIIVVAIDDLPVHRDAGLVGKVAFSAGGGNGGRREPVPFAVAQTDDHITGVSRVVEIPHLHFVDHFVGGIPGTLVDAVGSNGSLRARLPGEKEIGRLQWNRKRQPPQRGKKN